MYRRVRIRKRRKRLILVCPNSERNMNYVQRLDELHLLEKYTVYPEKIELITVTLDVPVDKYVFKKIHPFMGYLWTKICRRNDT